MRPLHSALLLGGQTWQHAAERALAYRPKLGAFYSTPASSIAARRSNSSLNAASTDDDDASFTSFTATHLRLQGWKLTTTLQQPAAEGVETTRFRFRVGPTAALRRRIGDVTSITALPWQTTPTAATTAATSPALPAPVRAREPLATIAWDGFRRSEGDELYHCVWESIEVREAAAPSAATAAAGG